MSLYASYLKERTGKSIFESEKGFATYCFNLIGDAKVCYIEDIYVVDSERHTGEASRMADEIAALAKSQDCKALVGSVCPTANHSTASLKVLLSYGFQLWKAEPNMIWFSKEI